ncbi:MAG: DsbA family protein [Gammaproteobacteria bacterium]|nr:DsbA family protein [Gammaproteobacteria bacterium]
MRRFVLLVLVAALAPIQVVADGSSPTLTAQEEAMVERITNAVIERLMSSETLDERIASGIETYVERQQAEQRRSRQREAERRGLLARKVERVGAADHVLGRADAPLTLIEYSDFECPFCKRFHKVAMQLVAQMPDKVNWVYRHFPLEFHNPGAQKQAEASECAAELGGNDAFWRYTDTLYERTRSGGKGFPAQGLSPLAGELGLDRDAFDECMASERMAQKVKQQYQSGLNAGIRGTPGNILLHTATGEVEVFAGAATLQQLTAAAQRLLAKANDDDDEAPAKPKTDG